MASLLRYGMMFLAAALSCAVIQEGDFLQGVRDGGLSPEAAESFPFLVGPANWLRETPVDPPTSPEPAAVRHADAKPPVPNPHDASQAGLGFTVH